jgi:hypothetical protein
LKKYQKDLEVSEISGYQTWSTILLTCEVL